MIKVSYLVNFSNPDGSSGQLCPTYNGFIFQKTQKLHHVDLRQSLDNYNLYSQILTLDVMGQDGNIELIIVVLVPIHVMHLRVIVVVMMSAVTISYVDMITALIHFFHIMSVVMTRSQVRKIKLGFTML